jgi:hypothetical protein
MADLLWLPAIRAVIQVWMHHLALALYRIMRDRYWAAAFAEAAAFPSLATLGKKR